MHQHVGALQATHRRLDTDVDATQGCLGGSWLSAPWRLGVLVTRARWLRRDGPGLPTVRRWPAARAASDTPMQSDTPSPRRGARVLPPALGGRGTAQGPPTTDPTRVRPRPARVVPRRLWCVPLSGSRCVAASCDRCEARAGASRRRRSTPGTAACHSCGVPTSRDGLRSQGTRGGDKIGENFGRFACALDRTRAHGVPRTAKVGSV